MYLNPNICMETGSVSPEVLFAGAQDRPGTAVSRWGRTLVIAPHPDDESLGCGGAIALLRQHDLPVHVIFVSDGTMSHPDSVRYPAEARRHLREEEGLAAIRQLGLERSSATFLRLPDTKVPGKSHKGFDGASELLTDCLQRFRPDTVLVPWRRDPHGDHRASWQLTMEALTSLPPVALYEYFIWTYELAKADDLPLPEEGTLFRLDVSAVLPQKLKAIEAHVSQTTRLIDDDPGGFILTPDVLAHFIRPVEVYLTHD